MIDKFFCIVYFVIHFNEKRVSWNPFFRFRAQIWGHLKTFVLRQPLFISGSTSVSRRDDHRHYAFPEIDTDFPGAVRRCVTDGK